MTKKLILPVVLLVGISSAALAADIDGKWMAEVEGRNGALTETLILKSSGSALTGSFQGARGGAMDISEGMIDGNNVSFKVVREFNGNQFAQQYKGTFTDAGELNLTVSMGGGQGRRGGFGGGGQDRRGGSGGQRSLVFKRTGN